MIVRFYDYNELEVANVSYITCKSKPKQVGQNKINEDL